MYTVFNLLNFVQNLHNITKKFNLTLHFINIVSYTCKADTGSDGAFHTADINPPEPRKNSIGLSKTSNNDKVIPAVASGPSAGASSSPINASRPSAYNSNYNRIVHICTSRPSAYNSNYNSLYLYI